ncbi:MAG: aldose 1-epimerase family protein [Clostridia bacterium]|nr:aldose 1-epimerase family protein [Clostridia bacterium]
MTLISIQNQYLHVEISTRGAELQSIRDSSGNERLWQGDPAFWTGRAPILFPICGGLREDTYYLDGQRYSMPKHGFAKISEWQTENISSDRAVFLLTEMHPGFPFRYELRAIYQLVEKSLKVTYAIQNLDDRTFCCSVGSHEAWATPGGLESYSIKFEQPEQLANYSPIGNLLPRGPVILGENVCELPLKTEYFAIDALVFPHLKSRAVTLKKQDKEELRVSYDGMDVLLLWTKPGANYICIEPWCSAPDYVDSDMQIRDKPGILTLAPGKETERTHLIEFF